MKPFVTTKRLALLLCLPGILCACENGGTDEEEMRVMVRVRLDWSQSNLEPETADGRITASLWFFPESGGEPQVLTTDELRDSIPLPAGDYRVLAFNGLLEYTSTRDELTSGTLPNIGFRNTGRYDTFEAFCRTPQTDALTAQPDILAADHYRNFVTGDLLSLSATTAYRDTLVFTPVRLTAQVQLTVHIDNLVSAAGGNLASISGLAESVRLATGERGSTLVGHEFVINSRQYDTGSAENGTLRGECYTFGIPGTGAGRNTLSLSFVLRDGTPYTEEERDITSKLTPATPLLFKVEINKEDGIRLPDTQHPDGEGSDLDADVNEWGENMVKEPLDI